MKLQYKTFIYVKLTSMSPLYSYKPCLPFNILLRFFNILKELITLSFDILKRESTSDL